VTVPHGSPGRETSREIARLPGDYHVHTTWSDGSGTVEDVVRRAAELGLPEIAVAEHFTPSPGPDEDWWLRPEQLGAYVQDVQAAAARHGEIKVLLGVEAEYVAGEEAELEKQLSAWPFEVVVLGVHVVDGFVFDDPSLRTNPCWDDPDALLAAYYRTVRRAAEWGRFDIFAHIDYIGLWGHRPGPAALPEIEAALDALAASGAAIELNTDRFTDPAGVMYPSVAILRAARARGIPLTIDSDAHEVEHVGRAWDEAIARAHEAGYRETLRLSDRVLVPLPG
jgi:histidinol-phosphatase (PHP family)